MGVRVWGASGLLLPPLTGSTDRATLLLLLKDGKIPPKTPQNPTQNPAARRLFTHRGDLAATAAALHLARSLRQRLWDGSAQPCRQLPGVGRLMAERLAAAGARARRPCCCPLPALVFGRARAS